MSQSPLSESVEPAHRERRRFSGPATAVTAGIAAGALALAGFAVSSTTPAPDTAKLQASIARVNPQVASDAVSLRGAEAGEQVRQTLAQVRELRTEQAVDSFAVSADLAGEGLTTLTKTSAAISKAKAEKRAAERAEAERKAAEERAAAERAAAERAAQQRAAEQAASRSSERQAPAPSQPSQPAPAPAPAPAPPPPSGDSRSIARSMLGNYGWGDDQWGCLNSLWQRESGWNHRAMNPSSGAYGIPQSLPGSKMASAGADWQTNPATQIRWGLGYIKGRYGNPCGAWAHSERVGWY